MIINGSPQGFSKSSRRLRQGDPISPALFIVGAEVLSQLLNALIDVWRFVPFNVPRGYPIITHLAYADDVMKFSSGLKSSLQSIMRYLEAYCSVLGQLVNFQKSGFLVHQRLYSVSKHVIS